MKPVPETVSVFGKSFKIRCCECTEQSGWMTVAMAKEWWREHAHIFSHYRMATFMKKF